MNMQRLIRACERNQCWKEAVYLEHQQNNYDKAVNMMMDHSPVAFTHEEFVNIIQKVSNQNLYYKGILF
jgi:clathrin heavy chain